MTNKELITKISIKSNLPVQDVEKMLEVTVSTFADMLVEGKTVGIQGFGNFEVKKKDERMSVHPTTKHKTLVPPKLVVNFKISNVLKDKLKTIQK